MQLIRKHPKKIYFVLLPLMFFLVPIFLNFFVFWDSGLAKGSIGDWISFYGGYIGGIIGGIVAYIAARTQIVAQKERENELRFVNQLPTLTKISLELSKIRSQLEVAKDIPNNLPSEMPEEVRKNIYKSRLELEPLIKERWTNLENIINPYLLSELYKFVESYERTMEVLGYNLTELELKIKRNLIEKDKLEKKINAGEANEIEKLDYELLINNLQNDSMKLRMLENDKRHYWSELERAYSKACGLEKKVNELIKKISEKLEND